MAHWSRLRVPDALSSENLGSEPGELPLTEMKNMKNLFILFTFMPDFSMGPLLILQNPALILFFSLKRTHSSEKEEGKICSFFNYPHLLHLLPPPRICLPQRMKAARGGCGGGGGGGAAQRIWLALWPPSLSNSSRPPLLCMKHRSRLKAFSGHSDAEEKRSSELY